METTKTQKRNPAATMLDPKIVMPAITPSFTKLRPARDDEDPVMFVVETVGPPGHACASNGLHRHSHQAVSAPTGTVN